LCAGPAHGRSLLGSATGRGPVTGAVGRSTESHSKSMGVSEMSAILGQQVKTLLDVVWRSECWARIEDRVDVAIGVVR
jgi:hypothetical protein